MQCLSFCLIIFSILLKDFLPTTRKTFFGFVNYATAKTLDDISEEVIKLKKIKNSSFLEILVKPGYRKDLIRPDISPYKNKLDFLTNLKSLIFISINSFKKYGWK